MDLSKSIDFLLENAGTVIQYRLHKEILKDVSAVEEENLLDKVYQMPQYKLVESYVKPTGYIGIGAHSADRLHQTYLQDGETAARLLANYGIPKHHPLITGFVASMRNEEKLREEFTFNSAEEKRYKDRHLGLNNVSGLMALLYTMQAMLGWGDDKEVQPFQQTSLNAFNSILPLSSVEEILQYNPNLKAKYNYPFISIDTYYPSVYHLTALAYTKSWRTPEAIDTIVNSINHMDEMLTGIPVCVKLHGKFTSYSLWKITKPFRPFSVVDFNNPILYRRVLTEIAMLGVGERVNCICKSVYNIEEALKHDGILRFNFPSAKQKRRCFPVNGNYPTAYVDPSLEENYKTDTSIDCEMTFWAVEFLNYVNPIA